MRATQRTVALMLCSVFFDGAFAQEKIVGYTVKYSAGSLPNLKTGQTLILYLDPTNPARIVLAPGAHPQTAIPANSVTELSYGQEVHRRIGTAVGLAVISLGVGALAALSKSKKHYIGLVWDAGEGKKGGCVIQADKNEYRGILAALEGLTGKTAINTDAGQPNS